MCCVFVLGGVVWNRSVFKNKANLKLSAVDIFCQYKAITHISDERGISEVRVLSLPFYMIMTASYKFNKNPKKN